MTGAKKTGREYRGDDLATPGGSQTPAPAVPPDVASLYSEYAAELEASLRRIFGGGPPEPADVVQEAFQRLLARGDLSSIGNVRAFIWQIARNLILKDRQTTGKRSKRQLDVQHALYPGEGDDLTLERIIISKQEVAFVTAFLRSMPAKRRRALILHRLEGVPIAEVARRLGMSPTAARKHLVRGAAELNAALLKRGGE
ncbi:MAG: RNA polymerase sigma factor [Pseudomonadota bacterium]